MAHLDPQAIPADWPVQPTDATGRDIATCGACGLSWDDSISTGITPTPSARCPFENFHAEPHRPVDTATYGNGKVQDSYRFSNGYGASVVGKPVRIGCCGDRYRMDWELATVRYYGPRVGDYDLTHLPEVTGDADVVIRLASRDGDDVQELLDTIAAHPAD